MDDYAGRVLADRYRLPLSPSDEFELAETRAFDTYSGQEVLVRQVPLPEVIEGEALDADGLPEGYAARDGGARRGTARITRRPTDPAVRRAIEAAQAAAQIPDHPRLDQVFDVFAEGGSLWVASELVPARPLAALLAEKPLTPHRAAEVAADVLTALRVLHAHGWVHRNITARTVLLCDDGRVILTGLAAGAAQEALCGYDPVPVREFEGEGAPGGSDPDGDLGSGAPASPPYGSGSPTSSPCGSGSPTGSPYGSGVPANHGPTGCWGPPVPAAASRRGPATALAAERARQARMAVVGPVTERWAPEQAGPVHENWQLAAPIGPATDLWALGALLFRAVQGHAPYPEENTAELVRMVCSEPPAFAEECGPLRPVVESLLRQDPTERLDFEELRGWLRSLVRSAPEPEGGVAGTSGTARGAERLPIVRRRDELVRRRRAGCPAAHARHRRAKQEKPPKPRSLGRNLILLILLVLAGAVAYAMLFMPEAEPSDGSSRGSRPETGQAGQAGQAGRIGRAGAAGDANSAPEADSESHPGRTSPDDEGGDDSDGDDGDGGSGGDKNPPELSSSAQGQSSDPEVARGFTLRKDSEGFQIAVASGWARTPKNRHGQVVYAQGKFELIVVPGRDSTATYDSDPLAYQREDERELQPFRDSTWATSSGMRLIEVGGRTMAEGQFTWQDSAGREIFVRNLAILIDGRYHVVQVRGPEAERDEVTRLYEQASATYQVTG